MKRAYARLALGLVLVLGLLSLFHAAFPHLISYSMAQEFVASHPLLAPFAFIMLYIIDVVAFLPAAPLSVLAGALFGTVFGSVYVLVGATAGAMITFFLARFLARAVVGRMLEGKESALLAYDEKLANNGFLTVLILRLIPVVPFSALNYALGLTRVKAKDMFLATAIGIIPGDVAYVYAGATAAHPSLEGIVVGGVLIGSLFLIPSVYKHYSAPHAENK